MGVKGFFIVRQKRIPTTLCQGLSIGVDRAGHVPTIPLYETVNNQKQWQYVTDKRLKKPKLYRQQGSKDAGTKASRDV